MSSDERDCTTEKKTDGTATTQDQELQSIERTSSMHSLPSASRSTSPCESKRRSIYVCNDYTRPLPSREDTVVYLKGIEKKICLAFVHRVNRKKQDENSYEGAISGQTVQMETIPSCREIRRFVEEVLLVDRGFSTGETVIKFENDSIGNPTKEHLRIPRHDTSIGQVVNVEVRGDVMVVPWKKMVVKNVPLGKNVYTELINQDFFTHNYIFYQGWIGNALECVNDVTLLYRGRYRFVVREGGRNGVFLHRRDRSDARKALVPGEHVVISIGEAIGRHAIWEQQPPKSITCLRRRRVTEGVRCVIEKVETHSLIVEWIMSPSSTNRPPRIIPKSEVGNVIHFDSSVNSRLTVGDRVKITPDSLSTVITREEFFTDLTNQFKDSFEKLISKEDHPLTHSEVYSQSSQLDVKKSPIAKGAKVACMSDTEKRSEGSNSVSSHSSHDFNHTEPEIKMRRCGGGCETSSESTEENGALANCGRPRVAVVRSLVGQRRRRRCPVSRRRSTPFTPVDTAELAKEILNNQFFGEVLLTRSLVDVLWMDGTIESKIPSYLLIPYDPDLDQQDHLPGVIVAHKDEKNTDAVFGLILSTNCAERSCVVAWFERGEHSVQKRAEEKCTLFDIMAHPTYKRLIVGNYGVSVNHTSDDMREVIFQIIADLTNGKQLVRFLNGIEEELWPFDIVPLQYLDDSLESDDEDEMSTSEADQSEHISLFSVTLDEVREVLCRLGFSYSGTSNQPNVICEEEVIAVSKHLLEYYPPLENFTKEISPEDDDARNVEIFFAGVMLEASGEKCNELSKPLVQFAALMANAYRSRLLPECFDIQLLSVLVDGYTSGSVSFRNSRFNKEGDELAFSLNESINNARRYPEWLPIFHCISELFRGCYENSLRITLRSVFYMFDRTYFFPRYLSWEYVMFLNNTIRMASQIVDNDSGCVPIQKCVYWTTGEKHSFDKLPRITLISEASTRKIDLTMFAITLMAQIMDCEKQPVENISLLVGDEVAFVDFLESVPNMSLHSAINVTFAAALVLLTRCGILCQTASSDGFCVWKNLNFFFSYSYNPPVQVKYTVLHEIITFVRSVDFLTPALLQRLTEFTQSHSFEAVYNYVEHALDEKSKESENICETPCDPPNSEESASPTNDDRNGNIEGTFQVIDEFIDTVPNDVSDIPVGNKFYMTLYKEHKMLAKNMPDNIHVHAFANRLDVLHVLIIGPAGTPFETTPFFFKFKLPYDYPERPPNVTYVAYSQEQLNPNLYQNGKVCTSLLGTWSGKGVETWDPKKSNLLQVLLSIQALILVPEPYFNEAGYENRKLQSEMGDKSRRYNETAAINSLEYLHKIYMEPPTDFKNIIREFVRKSWPLLHRRISDWISGSASPSFPVMNSEGFKVALKKMACKITTTINAQEGEQTENAESLEVPEAVQSVST